MATPTNLYEYYTSQGQALPSVSARAPIYTQYGGQGTYTGTAEQNTFLLGQLSAPQQMNVPVVQGGQTYYSSGATVPSPITKADLQSRSPLTLPPPEPQLPPQPYIPPIQTVEADASDEGVRKADTAIDEQLKRIEGIFQQQGQAPAREAELQAQAGLPEQQKQLNELYNQIRQINVSAFQFQQDQEGRLAPTFAISGAQAQAQRQASARTYGLAAAAEALQGNIALAQDNIKRSLDIEFEPLKAQIEYQKLILARNYDKLDKEEQKRADEINRRLDERDAQIKQQQSDRAATYNLVVSAIENAGKAGLTVPNTLINQAYQSTPEQATALLSQYLGAQEASEQWSEPYLLGGDYVQRNSQTGEIRTAVNVAEGGGGGGGTGGGGLTDQKLGEFDLATQYAESELASGKTPEQVKVALIRDAKELSPTQINSIIDSAKSTISPSEKALSSTVKGNVQAMKTKNAPIEDILQYILFAGYEPDTREVKSLLEGYAPVKEPGALQKAIDFVKRLFTPFGGNK